MQSLKKYSLYSLLFLGGVGFQQIYSNNQINFRESFDAKTQQFLDYLKEHRQIYPKFYDTYLNFRERDHFLEKLILKESNGLNHYKIFLPQDFLEHLYNNEYEQMTYEEKLEQCKLSCVFKAGSSLQGHMNVVHGGFQATLIDNLYGYLGTLSNDFKPCATASLNINYKKPVKVGQEYIIKMKVSKIDGRKVYIDAKVEDSKGTVYTESNALMISVNWGTSSWKKLFTSLHNITKFGEKPQEQTLLTKDIDFYQPENIFAQQKLMLHTPISNLLGFDLI